MTTTPGLPEPSADSPFDPKEIPMDTTDSTQQVPAPTHGPAAVPTGSSVPPPLSHDRPRLRVGTTVWGLVVIAIGVGLIALAAGAVFDVQLAVIGLVAAAGIALLVGSLLTATGRRR